jgi:8-oxo-dGTP pyrophosphatase MutT (NUDIX family)
VIQIAGTTVATVTGNHDLRVPHETSQAARILPADRYRSIVDVYVLLRRADGMILLLERSGTGYADGQLCPPSGHLEEGESVTECAVREAGEEVGVHIDPADLGFTHVVHHRSPEGQGRVGFFFTATRWAGEPANREPHKCAGLQWADPARPPANTVPYTAAALAAITSEAPFSLDGW